jgi:hypothetical protein
VSRCLPTPTPRRFFGNCGSLPHSDAAWPAATSRRALAGAVAAGALSGVAFTAAVVWQARNRIDTADGSATGQADPARAHRARHRPIVPAAFHLHATSSRPPKAAEPVSVLIPVRHDTDTAMTAIKAALGQRGVERLDVVVLDEGCPEATRTALRREFGDDPRVRILSSAPLPNGWSPRAHRGHQLAVAARGRVLLFAEACAPLGPDAAAAAAALLRGERLDLAVLDTGRPRPDEAAMPDSASESGGVTGSGVDAGSGTGSGARRRARTQTGTGTGSASRSGTGSASRSGTGTGTGTGSRSNGASASTASGASGASSPSQPGSSAGSRGPAEAQAQAEPQPAPSSTAARRFRNSKFQSVRTHPGRFAVAVDAGAYWRFGGYRAAAADPDPLALLRTMRRASGRVALADGRGVIPPASLDEPEVPGGGPAGLAGDAGTGVPTSSMTHRSPFVEITDTARRLLAAVTPVRW